MRKCLVWGDGFCGLRSDMIIVMLVVSGIVYVVGCVR